ncbi:MAG: polysaccharide biosynthesis tyrosine autokinase, partial [Victivallaceae bacterium]|nr:polysaccharide biosynthesis tyrosine autokinase [Victivallaceae bacterium]
MSKEVNFWFFVAVLRRCVVWCLLALVIGGVASGLFSKYFIHKKYRSAVSLYVGRSQDTKGDTDDYRTAARDLQIGLQLVEDYRELLNSRRIADKVRNLVELEYPDMPCKYSANVEPVRQTRMINVTVTAENPEVACKVANTMANVFIDEIQEILSIQNSQVIDSAEVNPNPVSPRIFRNSLIGGAVAFLIVYAIFALKILLDTRIRTPKDVEQELEMPILGTIPMFDDFENLPDGDSGKEGTRIVSVQKNSDKRFESSEPFSNLRTNIQYSGARSIEDHSCRTLLVTSTLSGEGKSFVSANMAASLADAGNRTLIINCDLRRPALSWTLGVESKKGLVNILAGESTFDDAVVRGIFGLKFDALLCGPIPPNPGKLLLSAEFRGLIDDLKKKYEYIVIDADTADPACLPGIFRQQTHGELCRLRDDFLSAAVTCDLPDIGASALQRLA